MLLPVQFPFTLLSTIVSPAYSEASPEKICSGINATSSLPATPQWKKINQSVTLRATLPEKFQWCTHAQASLKQLLSAWARLCLLHRLPGCAGHRENTLPIRCMYPSRGKVFS